MMNLENRFIKKAAAVRSYDDNDEKIIEGIIPYESPSLDMFLGYENASKEVITRTAFNKTLNDKKNVYCNFNHNDDEILGSTRANTLILENTNDGLKFRCKLPNTATGLKAYESIKRGDVPGVSFEFYPRDWYVENDISYIRSAQLEAISVCVPTQAYPDAKSFALRSLLAKRSIDIDELTDAIEKGEVNDSVKNLASALNNLISKNQIEVLPSAEDTETPEQPKDIQTEEVNPVLAEKLHEIQMQIEEELK